MRIVKPQSLAFQASPLQIGDDATLRTAACVGFRLSDPRILVHEAAIWSALKQSGAPGHFYAQTAPRPFAEWSLLGHATHRTEDSGASHLDWVASVGLGASRKVISCRQAADLGRRESGFVRVALSVNHANSHQGAHRQNPIGSKDINPPLQLATTTGWSADPWAAMTPVSPEWSLRRQFLPSTPAAKLEWSDPKRSPGAWPSGMDLRYFQQTSPNQQLRISAWSCDEYYELTGFGPHSEGYVGRLPGITVRQFDTDLDGKGRSNERVMALNSVVFLPDQDLALMWWQGSLPLIHTVEELPVLMTLAVDKVGQERSSSQLVSYAQRRIDPSDHDPVVMSDVPLMPSLEVGLAWDVITASEDHPSHEPPICNYDTVRGRLTDFEQQLSSARQAQRESAARLDQLKRSLLPLDHSTPAPGSQSWRDILRGPENSQLLEGATLRDQDLSEINLVGWSFKRVRFERCNFRSTKWKTCHLEDVTFSHCDFHAGSMIFVDAQRTKWDHSQLQHHALQGGKWSQVEWVDCQVDSATVHDIHWQQLVMTRVTGEAMRFQGADIQRWTIACGEAVGWQIASSTLDEVSLSDLNLSSLHVQKSVIKEMSAVRTNFEGALFEGCQFSKSVLSLDCVLDFSTFEDCVWQQSTWSRISASALTARHSSLLSFCASGCKLSGSQWRRCDLSKADFVNADFHGSVFEHCNLREAALFGANFGTSEVEGCNLIGAQLQWASVRTGSRWRNNLDAGARVHPRRTE